MKEKQKVIVLTGPTAVGKTALSIELAERLQGEIISADSMQVYRGMDIGTAKITKEQRRGISHYLIDCLDPDEEFNVAIFQKMAEQAVDTIIKKGSIPIITGGTAFYIQALLYGIDFSQGEQDASFRQNLYQIAKQQNGREQLYQILCQVDQEYAQSVHANNVKRVVRALEFHHDTGIKFSSYNQEQKEKNPVYDFSYFVLMDERESLYQRIDRRVDQMMEQGLLEEAKKLMANYPDRSLPSMQGVGYKELFSYLAGEIDLDQAVELIKKNTRHFAKRQITWFKREKNVIFLHKNDFSYREDAILEDMLYRMKDWI